jgi:hypothetical protein
VAQILISSDPRTVLAGGVLELPADSAAWIVRA